MHEQVPREPGAKVVLLRDKHELERHREIIHTGGGTLRRNCGQILGVR